MKSSKILAVVAMASLFAASSFAADEEIIAKEKVDTHDEDMEMVMDAICMMLVCLTMRWPKR